MKTKNTDFGASLRETKSQLLLLRVEQRGGKSELSFLPDYLFVGLFIQLVFTGYLLSTGTLMLKALK